MAQLQVTIPIRVKSTNSMTQIAQDTRDRSTEPSIQDITETNNILLQSVNEQVISLNEQLTLVSEQIGFCSEQVTLLLIRGDTQSINSERQILNSTIHISQRWTAILEPLVARDTGLDIPDFPTTVAIINELNVVQCKAILAALHGAGYQPPVDADLTVWRRRLRRKIGLTFDI